MTMATTTTNGANGAKPKAPSKTEVILRFLNTKRDKLADSIPSGLFSVDDFIRTFFHAAQTQPKILDCTKTSIWYALSQAAMLGLKVGTPLALAHLQPRKNKQSGEMEAKLIIGYRGYIELARRTGEIDSVQARCIFEGDEYDIDYARIEAPIRHKVNLENQVANPKILGAYCLTRLKGNPYPLVEVMTKSQIDKIRRRYAANNGAIWEENPDEMARKTVIRRGQKYWPLSGSIAVQTMAVAEEVSRASEVSIDTEDPFDAGEDTIDAEGRTVTADGEIVEETPKPGKGVAGAKARAQAQPALPQSTTTPAQQADFMPSEEEMRRQDAAAHVEGNKALNAQKEEGELPQGGGFAAASRFA